MHIIEIWRDNSVEYKEFSYDTDLLIENSSNNKSEIISDEDQQEYNSQNEYSYNNQSKINSDEDQQEHNSKNEYSNINQSQINSVEDQYDHSSKNEYSNINQSEINLDEFQYEYSSKNEYSNINQSEINSDEDQQEHNSKNEFSSIHQSEINLDEDQQEHSSKNEYSNNNQLEINSDEDQQDFSHEDDFENIQSEEDQFKNVNISEQSANFQLEQKSNDYSQEYHSNDDQQIDSDNSQQPIYYFDNIKIEDIVFDKASKQEDYMNIFFEKIGQCQNITSLRLDSIEESEDEDFDYFFEAYYYRQILMPLSNTISKCIKLENIHIEFMYVNIEYIISNLKLIYFIFNQQSSRVQLSLHSIIWIGFIELQKFKLTDSFYVIQLNFISFLQSFNAMVNRNGVIECQSLQILRNSISKCSSLTQIYLYIKRQYTCQDHYEMDLELNTTNCRDLTFIIEQIEYI